jgi:hypothetical protein
LDDRRIAREECPDHEELQREYFEQLTEMERQRGRRLLPSELEDFSRAFYAASYRADLARIPKAAWYEVTRELEEEEN